MYFHTALWRGRLFGKSMNSWFTDFHDFYNILHTRGGEAFA